MAEERQEGTCELCQREYRPWVAASPLWNAVMRAGGSINGAEAYDFVCANCFMGVAEDLHIAGGFQLRASQALVPFETVTPSGRIWNDQLFRWLDSEPLALEELAVRLTPNPALTANGTLAIILDGIDRLDEDQLARTLGYVVARNPGNFDGSGQGMDVEPMTDEQWLEADPQSKRQLILTAKAVKIALREMTRPEAKPSSIIGAA